MKYAILLLALSACSTNSGVVQLKHPITGATAQCGPFSAAGLPTYVGSLVQNELRYCVEDFQRQGYDRKAES